MIDRRAFGIGMASLGATLIMGGGASAAEAGFDLAAIERRRVVRAADLYLRHPVRTVTSVPAPPRSGAGRHDFYSEGDYWWPDPAHPGGPYVRRDGYANPAKFDGHRAVLMQFGVEVPALAAAWRITRDARYARRAVAHLRAWFVDPATRMTPDLAHGQAIVGVNTGRAIGIIDTIHIVEVARAADLFARMRAPGYDGAVRAGVEAWFGAYLNWLTTSPFGIEERGQRNNHGTAWMLQAAAFATVTGDRTVLSDARRRLTDIVMPDQIAPDGRQPLELARTKPYSYSLFNLDMMAAACQLLSTPDADLWRFKTADGRGIAGAIGYMAPYIADKARWPFAPDVENFDALPLRQPSLLFGGLALARRDWIALWRTLRPDPFTPEAVRSFPIRQPLLWTDGAPA